MGLRHAVALALIALGAATPFAQPARATSDVALALARTYLLVWQDTLASLVADEELSQEVSHYPPRSASGRMPVVVETRKLRSELLLLRAPAENIWLAFRDVIAVDGRIVNDRQTRFDALFSGPAAMMLSTAERIEEEGFRFNLGRNGSLHS
jgi:hypothetical protein